MEIWQKYLLLLLSLYSLISFVWGYIECSKKKNAFIETNWFFFLGAWVWGDAVVFGLFWLGVSIFCLLKGDFILFLLITSVFWVIRSLGEVAYWFNQQFSTIERNPPKKMRFYNVFHNDSVWFIYQIVWQCVAVISIVATIYLTHLIFFK